MGIIALIQAIIGLPGQINLLISEMKSLRDEWSAFQTQKWIQKLNQDMAPIENGPSTTEDKQNAAKNISSDIAGL